LKSAQLEQGIAMLVAKCAHWGRGVSMARARNVICVIVVVWLLILLGQIALLLFKGVAPNVVELENTGSLESASSASAAIDVDINKLQSFNLFGVVGELPVIVEAAPIENDALLNAEKTKLKLTLEGIVNGPTQADSVAVIVYQGKQDQYYVDDKLPVGGNVTLAQVLIDRVIIDNAGSYESLWLYDEDKNQQAVTTSTRRKVTTTAKSNVTDMRADANATNLAKDYRDRLYQNPASLAEVLRIQPAQKDGEMLGYRVSAGRDKQQFADLGFKTNDVVTSINGITLDEPSKALEIYKLMRSAKEATFTIDRNGESVDILVALDEDS
jgi:general secretion pathway protein C